MRLTFGLFLLLVIEAGCFQSQRAAAVHGNSRPPTTFAKLLQLARSGDVKSQNAIGFMLYFGEVAPRDRAAAHYWFHLAADQGNVTAQMSLALMHYLGEGVPRDITEAERYLRLAARGSARLSNGSSVIRIPRTLAELADLSLRRPQVEVEDDGELTYATFCAGCHGLNGIAAYAGAPSFGLGDRMEKKDADLLHTIIHGHGVMPNWGSKISEQSLANALRFVRTLPVQYEIGIAQSLRAAPVHYFLFGPMSADPIAYDPDYLLQ